MLLWALPKIVEDLRDSHTGVLLSFKSHVALMITAKSSYCCCKRIILIADKFIHNIKGLPSIIRHNRCYSLQPLMTAPPCCEHGINCCRQNLAAKRTWKHIVLTLRYPPTHTITAMILVQSTLTVSLIDWASERQNPLVLVHQTDLSLHADYVHWVLTK